MSLEKKISLFKKISQTTNPFNVTLDKFLQAIREGKWQDDVFKVRNAKNEQEYNNAKTALPYATISGTFEKRNEKGLTQHSNLIAIDIDNIAPDEFSQVREVLENDKYSYSVFTSCGGFGLVVLVKIDGAQHKRAFEALEAYYYKHYHVIIDTSCKDVSRPRFVSYDPNLYLNEKSERFANYLPKPKKAEIQPTKIFFSNSDLDNCVNQIQERNIDIVKGEYARWLRIGFGFAEQLGEAGRDLFHAVSQYDGKYDSKTCDKQYDNCLKARNTGITIATFFYYCKEAGIQIVSENTLKMGAVAIQGRNGKLEKEKVIQNIKTVHQIDATDEDINQVVEQVYNSDVKINKAIPLVDEIETYITSNYNNIRFNQITHRLEHNNIIINERFMNEMWRQMNKTIERSVSFESVKRTLLSNFVQEYNPIVTWFEQNNTEKKQRGHIAKLAQAIPTDTGLNLPFNFAEECIKRWLVGMVSMAHGEHSPLMLMLIGSLQQTGKTEFFRRLLPKELKRFYAESKLDAGKDDFLLMCENMMILNDEYEGRTVNDEKLMKQLLSKQIFSLRAPYAAFNEDRIRIAALCATSNEEQVLKDPTGNRRMLPIRVIAPIDFELYNSIDKKLLILEAYQLYKEGYDWEVKGEFLKLMNESTNSFDDASAEAELIQKFFTFPKKNGVIDRLTATEIQAFIQKETQLRLSKRKLGLELKRLGFQQEMVKVDGNSKRVWLMKFRSGWEGNSSADNENVDVPF